MKRYRINLTYFALLFCALVSCSKQDIATYSGEASVYFDVRFVLGPTTSIIDSSTITFAYAPDNVRDSVFNLTVRLLGNPVHYDREISFHLVDSLTTAIPGVHYDMPSHAVLVLPADSFRVLLPITFHRTADMKGQPFYLTLELDANASFKLLRTTTLVNTASSQYVSTIRHRIKIDDNLARPVNWSEAHLGTYSRTKLLFICDITELAIADFSTFNVPKLQFIGRFAQKYLNDQSLAGTPVLDEDGSLMKMGTAVQ